MSENYNNMFLIIRCPRCTINWYVGYDAPRSLVMALRGSDILPPALSRADNITYICSGCGTEEAVRDYLKSKETQANKPTE